MENLLKRLANMEIGLTSNFNAAKCLNDRLHKLDGLTTKIEVPKVEPKVSSHTDTTDFMKRLQLSEKDQENNSKTAKSIGERLSKLEGQKSVNYCFL